MQEEDPSLLNLPGGQGVSVGLMVPGPQVYPAGQRPLQAGVVSMGDSPYVPSGQGVQLLAPCSLYAPTGHRVALGLVAASPHMYPALQSKQVQEPLVLY